MVGSNNDESVFALAEAAGLPTERFPQTNQEADLIEGLLAKEMEKLSMDEHEKILFDVHGFVDFEDEDPAAVELKLKELDDELSKIQDKEAYTLAKTMNEKYVSSRKFRMMFLRREQFHVQAAAQLIVKHFDVKRRLFGSGEVLGRDVRQSDLTSEDRQILESGYCQILPKRDSTGRSVFVASSHLSEFHKSQEWKVEVDRRAIWYLCMAALQDEETQKKGVVWVAMQICSFTISPEQCRDIQEVDNAIPYKVVSGHFCYYDASLRPLAVGCRLFSSSKERYRMITHFGTPEEIDFELQTYGIPTKDIQIRENGSLDETAHKEFLAMLRSQEEIETAKEEKASNCETEEEEEEDDDEEVRVVVPGRFDVLFGKSRFAKEHTGTRRALHIVEMHFDSYERLTKFQKADVADRIISVIHESGGRFLRQNEDKVWVLADDDDARKKIGHWFRHTRSKRAGAVPSASTKPAHTNDETISGSTMKIAGTSTTKRLASCFSEDIHPLHFPEEAPQVYEHQFKKAMPA